MGVPARLEVDVQGAVHRTLARRGERLLLGVRFPSLAMEAFAREKAAGIDHHGAHHRIGAGPVVRLACELQGAGGPLQVYGAVAIGGIQCT